ncbi:hypothetical protein AJ79_05532, partial [Helicocarpus griseus UAMH5409]
MSEAARRNIATTAISEMTTPSHRPNAFNNRRTGCVSRRSDELPPFYMAEPPIDHVQVSSSNDDRNKTLHMSDELTDAKAMMAQRDFASAEWYLERLLSRTSKGHRFGALCSAESIERANLMLADAYRAQGKRAQGKLDETLDLLESFIEETSSPDSLAGLDAQTLPAQIYASKKVFNQAEQYCKSAVDGKQRILGTAHPSFRESVELLKSIQRTITG